MKTKDVIFIAGYPGAGKGTICQQYSIKQPDFYHVSAGDLIRDVITQKTNSAYREALITTGDKLTKTSPAWVISGIITERLNLDPNRVCLLDGFPQRKEELDNFARSKDINIIGSIFFDASLENCIGRMQLRGIRDFELFGKSLSDSELRDYYQNRYIKYSKNVEFIEQLLMPYGLQHIDANHDIQNVNSQFERMISQFNQRRK